MNFKSILTILLLSIFMLNCTAKKNQVEQDPERVLSGPGLSFGSVLAELEIINQENSSLDENQLEVKVIEVLEYGSSTPILEVNSSIIINVPSGLYEERKLNELENGKVLEAIITKPVKRESQQSLTTWNLLEIKEIK